MLYISISLCISHRQLNKVMAQLDLLKSLFDLAGVAKHGHAHFNPQAAQISVTEGLSAAAQVSKCGWSIGYYMVKLGGIPVCSHIRLRLKIPFNK